ncbi:SDR family NAD(P)-dependent oxidoreductase [Legionella dresdenensis]|uniref:SDR family NAD(P)-dependent oxidoreductase n=1 Tax=Legionella dresdenensis TaxID=450200 RepID=A0ABV8CGL3_9GAMM
MYDKSAIITGASKGIGREVAKHLARKGYNLLLISRSKELLAELQQELKEININLIVNIAAIDVYYAGEVNLAITNFYKTTNSVDLLFNNAGYVKRGTSDIDPIELSTMINSNLIGAIDMIRATVPLMKIKNSGYIINVSSRSAETPRSLLGGYAATKAALLAFNESLYKEMKNTNIKVTALCPGLVDTEMTSDVKEDRSKLIKTADICATIDFLLSLSPAVALKKLSFESIVQVGGYS